MGKKNRRLFRIIGGVIALFFLVVIIRVCIVFLSRPSYLMPDTTEWQTGDIFFSVGDSWESVAVRSLSGAKNFEVSDSTPSHCGIIVRDADGVRLVHASTVAKKIAIETPEEYLKNNGSYCLYVKSRPFLLDTIKIKSDIDSLLRIPITFDFEFNHSDSKSLYCTELVVLLHELNGCNSLSHLRTKLYIYPQDILNTLNMRN